VRVVFLFSLIFAILVVWLSLRPDYATQLAQKIGESAMTALYEREVAIHGGDDDLQREVFTKIKRGGSNLQLRFTPEDIEKKILALSTVQSVNIEPCSLLSLGCYVVTLEQRTPYYKIYKTNSGKSLVWLSSKEGSFIQNGDNCSSCIPVLGLDAMTSESSEGAQRALAKLSMFIAALKATTRCEVLNVEFLSSQELNVILGGCASWQVLFSFPYEKSVYEKELERLKEVLLQFSGKESVVKRVELSYDKIAVVSLQEGVKLAKQEEPKVKAKTGKQAHR
jgi:hypothetical protein